MRIRGHIVTTISDWSEYNLPSSIVKDVDGQAYLICNEGVGRRISDSEYDVLMKSKTGVADLADFIRVFGARLDNNHHLWVRQLEGKGIL